jgi:hypothetical protein
LYARLLKIYYKAYCAQAYVVCATCNTFFCLFDKLNAIAKQEEAKKSIQVPLEGFKKMLRQI